MSANILDSPMAMIINENVSENRFSDGAKEANVPPPFLKNQPDRVSLTRPVSLLNVLSKVLERWTKDKIEPFVNEILYKFISAYRQKFSSNHVLLRLLEEWKKILRQQKFVGAVIMDLSKAFHCIPHDLLTAKMEA